MLRLCGRKTSLAPLLCSPLCLCTERGPAATTAAPSAVSAATAPAGASVPVERARDLWLAEDYGGPPATKPSSPSPPHPSAGRREGKTTGHAATTVPQVGPFSGRCVCRCNA